MKLREFNFNTLKGYSRPVNLCVKEKGPCGNDPTKCFEEPEIGDTLRKLPVEWADREIVETRWFFDTFVIEVESTDTIAI